MRRGRTPVRYTGGYRLATPGGGVYEVISKTPFRQCDEGDAMKIRLFPVVAACAVAALFAVPAGAAGKNVDRDACERAGGAYSEGGDYTRCEYPDGGFYACNAAIGKCRSCAGETCTAEPAAHALTAVPPERAPARPVSPAESIRLIRPMGSP